MPQQQRLDFAESIHDGMRVTFGHGGPVGTLFFCKRRFWKVRMDAGDWRWPDGIVVLSAGSFVRTCQECDLQFRTDKAGEVFCNPCDRRMDMARAHDPGSPQQFERMGRRPVVRYPKSVRRETEQS